TTTYAYDFRNRLVGVVDKTHDGTTVQTVTYSYDAFDRRIARAINGSSAYYLLDRGEAWADVNGAGSTTARYLLGNRTDEMLARYWPSAGTVWYLADNVGTIRDIMG